jgi:phage terminase large subunit-like protein
MHGDQLGRKPGEVLWSEKYPLASVRKKHANVLDYEAAAQFQQLPRLEKGDLFHDDDFEIVGHVPAGLQWYAYIDLALGKTETSDFNAVAPVAMDADGNLLVRDLYKERKLEVFLKNLATLMLSDAERGTIWGFEEHSFQSLVVRDFFKDPRLTSVAFGGVKLPWSDKVEGARPWAIRARNGRVKLVRGPWNRSFIRTASGFPDVKHDDEIDTVSGGNHMIAVGAGGLEKPATSEAVVVMAEELFGSVTVGG